MIFSYIISGLFVLLIIGAILVILDDNGDSGRKVAWLLVITALPVVGLILYILVGINYRQNWFFKRNHRKAIDTFNNGASEELRERLFSNRKETSIREDYRPLSRILSKGSNPSVSTGNSFEIITDGHRKFEQLISDLRAAKESIHVEYFLFGDDSGSRAVKELLMQKAREGVEVRFIHENIANIAIRPGYYNEMKKAGVEVVKFNGERNHILNFMTMLNYRNHRKIVVIDGKVAYTGGMNISNKYFFVWRDTHMRLVGEAVASLQYVFMDSWLTSGGTLKRPFGDYFPQPNVCPEVCKAVQVVADEPDNNWQSIQMGYEWAIHNAKSYFWIQTPYFIPPEGVMDALKTAAAAGVDIRIMLPAKADAFYMGPANRSFFTECLETGIRIFEYEGRFIHSKTFVSDDYLSSIGTANMDYRSFNINYEVNTYIYDGSTARKNKEIFLKDLENCREMTLERWRERPWYLKATERFMRLFAPLL